jgi:hypothetical protein
VEYRYKHKYKHMFTIVGPLEEKRLLGKGNRRKE